MRNLEVPSRRGEGEMMDITWIDAIRLGFFAYVGVMLARVAPALTVVILESGLEKLRAVQVKNVAEIRSLNRKVAMLNLLLGEKGDKNQ